MAVKQIGRDPFARFDIVRDALQARVGQTCDWCGQVRQGKRGRRLLFRYGHWSDGGRTGWLKGSFCSYSCCKAYHG
jgi:hypothetical protein